MTKKTHIKKYNLQLKIPFVPQNENAELELIQESIKELRIVFSGHPQKSISDELKTLGNPMRYARVLHLVEKALKNSEFLYATEGFEE